MAPEQFLGKAIDARTDQFAFCIALYEALYGERPFAGDTVIAIADAVTDGRISAVPKNSDIPHWVRRVPDPRPARRSRPSAIRSVDDLLSRALANDPPVRRAGAADRRHAALRASRWRAIGLHVAARRRQTAGDRAARSPSMSSAADSSPCRRARRNAPKPSRTPASLRGVRRLRAQTRARSSGRKSALAGDSRRRLSSRGFSAWRRRSALTRGPTSRTASPMLSSTTSRLDDRTAGEREATCGSWSPHTTRAAAPLAPAQRAVRRFGIETSPVRRSTLRLETIRSRARTESSRPARRRSDAHR